MRFAIIHPTFALFLFLAVCLCPAEITNAAEEELHSVFPPGGRRGATTQVKIAGKNLKDCDTLLFSQSGITASGITAKRIAEQQFEVSVPADAPIGNCEVRALTPEGLSNPLKFVVGELTEINEVDNNDAIANSQPLVLPSVLNGRLERAADVDWYRFEGKAGQRVIVRCRSRSIDGTVEPALSLVGPNRRELYHTPSDRFEPFFEYQLTQSGSYFVRVIDRAYRSNSQSIYRLSIVTGPQLVAAFPPLLKKGRKQPVTLYGFQLPGGEPVDGAGGGLQKIQVDVTAPKIGESDSGGWTPFSAAMLDGFRYSHPKMRGTVRFQLTDENPVVEQESLGNSPKDAQNITIPTEIAGRFLTAGDLDWFRFSAKKNETIRIDAYGERLGRRMDLDVAIHDLNGKLLMSLPDTKAIAGVPADLPTATLDASGSWKAPADGEYLLLIRDLYGGSISGVDRVYQISVRRSSPGFNVFAVLPNRGSPRGLTVPRGGHGLMQLVAIRHDGFDSAIRIRSGNFPKGIEGGETWIAAGTNFAPYSLSIPEKFAGRLETASLVAEAQIDGKTVTAPVRMLAVTRVGSPVDVRLTDQLHFAVGSKKPFRISLAAQTTEVPAGSLLRAKIAVVTDAGRLDGPIQLNWQSLPKKAKAQSHSIEPETGTQFTAVEIPADLKPGWYTVGLSAAAKVVLNAPSDDKQKEPTAKAKPVEVISHANTISFQVITPVVQFSSPLKKDIRLTPGETVTIPFDIKRLDKNVGEMTVELDQTSENSAIRSPLVRLSKEQKSGELIISAGNELKASGVTAVVVKVTAKLGNRTVDSYFPLEITVVEK